MIRRRGGWGELELYRRHIYLLSASSLISSTGSIAAYVALVAVVYDRSGHSGTWVAAALVVGFGVSALLGPWAGHLGDRLDRRRLMIASDMVAAAAFVGIAFAHSLPLLVVLAGVASAAEVPSGPAAGALLVMVVPEERRTWATGTRSSSGSAGTFLGGAVGGFVVLATSLCLLGTGMINVAEYPLFVDMGGGSKAYGIAVAGWAIGGFVAGRLARREGDAYSERQKLLFGCGTVALAIGLCGVVPYVAPVVILFSIGGFAASTRSIAGWLIYQRWTPDHIRARTFSALGTANIGAIGIAMIVSGLVLNALTPAGVCIACGLFALLALIVAMRVPPRRRDDDAAPTAAAVSTSGRRRGWFLASA